MPAALRYSAACESDPLSWVKDAKSSTVKPSLQNRASEEKWHSNLLECTDWNTWISTSQKLFHFGQVSHQSQWSPLTPSQVPATTNCSSLNTLDPSKIAFPLPGLSFPSFLLSVQHQSLLTPLGSHRILSTISMFTIFTEIICLWACLAH